MSKVWDLGGVLHTGLSLLILPSNSTGTTLQWPSCAPFMLHILCFSQDTNKAHDEEYQEYAILIVLVAISFSEAFHIGSLNSTLSFLDMHYNVRRIPCQDDYTCSSWTCAHLYAVNACSLLVHGECRYYVNYFVPIFAEWWDSK